MKDEINRVTQIVDEIAYWCGQIPNVNKIDGQLQVKINALYAANADVKKLIQSRQLG
jgi:hypothetical protein